MNEVSSPPVSLTSQQVHTYCQDRQLQILQWFVLNQHVFAVWVCSHEDVLNDSFFIRFEYPSILWDVQTKSTFVECRLQQMTIDTTSSVSSFVSNLIPSYIFSPLQDSSDDQQCSEIMAVQQYFQMVMYVKTCWIFGKHVYQTHDFISPKPWMSFSVQFEFFDECRHAWPVLLTQYRNQWKHCLSRRLDMYLKKPGIFMIHMGQQKHHDDVQQWRNIYQQWDVYLDKIARILQELSTFTKALQLEWESLDDDAQCPTFIERTLAYADRKKNIYQSFDKAKLVLKYALETYAHTFIHIHHFWWKVWIWTRYIDECESLLQHKFEQVNNVLTFLSS